MLVRAKERVFYLWVRQPGEEFELRDPDLFSPTVMEKVEPPAPEAAPEPPPEEKKDESPSD